jgi:hypothetical protein
MHSGDPVGPTLGDDAYRAGPGGVGMPVRGGWRDGVFLWDRMLRWQASAIP